MMKVYQPLCPDITFRLAADISPDMLEEETTPGDESDADLKYKLFQDSNNFHHTRTRHNLETVGAQPFLAKTAKEIYNQEHVHSGATPTAVSTAASSCLSSPPPSLSCPSVAGTAATSEEPSAAEAVACGQKCDDVEKCYPELQPKPTAELSCAAGCEVLGGPPVSQGRDDSGNDDGGDEDNGSSLGSHQEDDVDDEAEKNGEDSVIDDTPSSHSLPVSRSSSRSPLAGLLVVAAPGEERGTARGSASTADLKTFGAAGKPTSLRLEQQRPVAKYQGPYTLACDITPSPLGDDVDVGTSLPEIRTHISHDTNSLCANAATSTSLNTPTTSATSPMSNTSSSGDKPARRPRKLPEIPRKHQGLATASSAREKSIFDEIQEALIKEVAEDEVFDAETSSHPAPDAGPATQYPFILKHVGHLFDKKRLLIGYTSGSGRTRNVSRSSVLSEAAAMASPEEEAMSAQAKSRGSSSSSSNVSWCSGLRRRKNSDGDGSKKYNSSIGTPYQDLEVTHRGMHRFIPRHADEVQVGIGDPIHVIKEYDDLWCEGVNLRTGERGIFPAMYANDLRFLEDSDGEEADYWKFTMRYLGSVEVNAPHGDHALCQAITRVAQQGRIKTASLSTLEINQYGIRMIDKSKDGHQSNKFSHFFALKNISFCGTHPSNNRYFAFITKHPRQTRFACHVFHSDRSTHRARDALGNAFKRFYQEYMAFTHPTEDIWME